MTQTPIPTLTALQVMQDAPVIPVIVLHDVAHAVPMARALVAGGIRMLGNLLGDPMQEVVIGAEVQGVFEHHEQASTPHTLLQWQTVK